MVITGGHKQDSWKPDDDVAFEAFVTQANMGGVDDLSFFKRLFDNLHDPRYRTTVLFLMLGYKKGEIAKIYGCNPSTINRFDVKEIVVAIQKIRDEE